MSPINAITSAYHALLASGWLPAREAQPFVIASGPRSGSTLLQTLLHSHRNVVCMHELLLRSGGTSRFRRYHLGRRKQLIQLREQDMASFLHAVLEEPHPPWVHAVGFKAMYVQPRDDADRRHTWMALADITGLRVIWLHRNPVRRVVSFAIAKKTGEWVGTKTSDSLELDPGYLVRRLQFDEHEANRAREAVAQCEVLDIQFESLVDTPGLVLKHIQDFLGVPHRSVHSALTSQNPRPLKDMISNVQDIRNALRDTKWEQSLLQSMHREPSEL